MIETQHNCSRNASLSETEEGYEVKYNGTKRTSMLCKNVTNVQVEGTILSRSYSFVASEPEVPSFTCITSFGAEENGSSIIGLATNIRNTTCETSPIIKVLCKYFIHNCKIWRECSFPFVFKICLVECC